MSFTIFGSAGSIRHRIHPKRSETRGPRGVVGSSTRKPAIVVPTVVRKHTVHPAARAKKTSLVTKAFRKVKGLFGGDR